MNTDQIQIYVRSSALGPAGIHWRNVSKPEQPKEEPEILGQPVVPDEGSKISIDSAINTVKPCLVLARYDGQILLEVTGIDATRERCEQEGRRISEVVLWVGDDNKETERQLRKLAHCALLGLWKTKSDFRTTISSSIEFDGLNEYKVSAENLLNIYRDPSKYTPVDFLLPDIDGIDNTSQDWLVQSDPERIETDEGVVQLATRLRQASFDGLDIAIAIVEIKQKEDKIYLNYRTYIVEKFAEPSKDKEPEVAPSPITLSPSPRPPQHPETDRKKKLFIAILGLLLILLIIFLGPLKNTVLNILPSQPTSQPVPTLMKDR